MDSHGKKRLRKIAKECVNYGQRVQNSVFECSLNSTQYIQLKNTLVKLMDKNEDTIRFYTLGNNPTIEHYGIKESYDPDGFIVV